MNKKRNRCPWSSRGNAIDRCLLYCFWTLSNGNLKDRSDSRRTVKTCREHEERARHKQIAGVNVDEAVNSTISSLGALKPFKKTAIEDLSMKTWPSHPKVGRIDRFFILIEHHLPMAVCCLFRYKPV